MSATRIWSWNGVHVNISAQTESSGCDAQTFYSLELKNREEQIRLLHSRVDQIVDYLVSVLQDRSELQCRSHSCSSVPLTQTSRYDSLLTCGIRTCQSNTTRETRLPGDRLTDGDTYYWLNIGNLCFPFISHGAWNAMGNSCLLWILKLALFSFV